ncbi:hypothetical protein ACUNGP_21805 [Serratia sp. IR-2025]
MSKETKETGGQAFPRQQWEYDGQNNVLQYQEDGMSLRDYFAAKAMQSIVPSPKEMAELVDLLGENTAYAKASETAYVIADAMLKARNS